MLSEELRLLFGRTLYKACFLFLFLIGCAVHGPIRSLYMHGLGCTGHSFGTTRLPHLLFLETSQFSLKILGILGTVLCHLVEVLEVFCIQVAHETTPVVFVFVLDSLIIVIQSLIQGSFSHLSLVN